MRNLLLSVIFIFFLFVIPQISRAQDNIVSWEQLSVEHYLYERTDFVIQLAASFNNPYDANEIALDLILTSPSSKQLILPCFYVNGDNGQSTWNARFLPQETGTYTFHFQLSKNSGVVASTEVNQFLVKPSAKNGIFHTNTNWAFTFDSGKPFRGIGENIGWEARDWENQSYTYDYFLPKLAQNGINFFRTWSCIWNLPIEWQIVQDTRFYSNTSEYFNPGGIQRMDALINMVDSLDMHIMLTLVPHGALITTGEWDNNPYNIKNGGPASTPTEFFTLEQSKQKFKNTLRYLVARWGYSPGIGVWEFCNEIDNAAYNGGSTLVIPESAITQWHTEMSAYLNETDIYDHPVSTSISHREIQGLYSVPDMDFNQIHIYRNTSGMRSKIEQYQEAYSKPFVIGEFGWDWDWNNVTTANGPEFDFDLKRGLWYGLFTSTPIVPLSWWWEFFDERRMTAYYSNVTSVSQKMLLAGNGDFKPAGITAYGIEKYAVQCGNSYFVYLLNNSTNKIESEVTLAVDKNQVYFVSSLNTSTNTYSQPEEKTPDAGKINLGTISLKSRDEMVFVLSPDKASIGFTSPYNSTPATLPGIIETENFDDGPEGSAYHDFETENTGGFYRVNSSVDIFANGNTCFISNIVKNEWLKYSVNFTESGSHSATATVSSEVSGKSFYLSLNGLPISEIIEVPNTGGIQNWQTIQIPLTVNQLEKGEKTITLEFKDSGFSIDKIEFKLENQAPAINLSSPNSNSLYTYPAEINLEATATDPDGTIFKIELFNGQQLLSEADSSSFKLLWEPSIGRYNIYAVATDNAGLKTASTSFQIDVKAINTIPGKIEAENYDIGENQENFLDLSEGNKFGFYRNDDIDIETCTDDGGGFSLGDFQTGEWVNYTVRVEESGTYNVDLRVATRMDGTKLSLSVDGMLVANSIAVANTGGWQQWATISVDGIQLSEGEHVITLKSVIEFVNINNLVFSRTTFSNEPLKEKIHCYPNPVKTTLYLANIPNTEFETLIINNIGIPVKKVSKSQSAIDVSTFKPGFYTLFVISPEKEIVSRLRFVKP